MIGWVYGYGSAFIITWINVCAMIHRGPKYIVPT